MIKNMLTRRKESDTYLATVSRHRWSRQITMKVDKLPELSSAEEESTFIVMSAPEMSTDSSQVIVALFPPS